MNEIKITTKLSLCGLINQKSKHHPIKHLISHLVKKIELDIE